MVTMIVLKWAVLCIMVVFAVFIDLPISLSHLRQIRNKSTCFLARTMTTSLVARFF